MFLEESSPNKDPSTSKTEDRSLHINESEKGGHRRTSDKQSLKEIKNIARPKPRSLPPLERIPKSPPLIKPPKEEEEKGRIFIGSPPPPGLINRQLSGSLDLTMVANENWRPEQINAGDENPREGLQAQTVYTPMNFSLNSSYPTIILKKAPKSPSEDSASEHPPYILSASHSTKSLKSLNSLVQSTSSLNLNSTLTLPPKFLFNGTSAVQEWVPDHKREESALSRRSSTPSIRELPSPLEGKTVLQSTMAHPSSKHKSNKLTPLPKKNK